MTEQGKQIKIYENRWPIGSTGFEAVHGKTHKYRVLCLGAFEDEIRNSQKNVAQHSASSNTKRDVICSNQKGYNMELKRIEVARQLWQMLRGILRDGGYVKSGSKMRGTANSFEDELYDPPKSESGDSKNDTQHLKTAIQLLKLAERNRIDDNWLKETRGFLARTAVI